MKKKHSDIFEMTYIMCLVENYHSWKSFLFIYSNFDNVKSGLTLAEKKTKKIKFDQKGKYESYWHLYKIINIVVKNQIIYYYYDIFY